MIFIVSKYCLQFDVNCCVDTTTLYFVPLKTIKAFSHSILKRSKLIGFHSRTNREINHLAPQLFIAKQLGGCRKKIAIPQLMLNFGLHCLYTYSVATCWGISEMGNLIDVENKGKIETRKAH